MRPIAWNLGTTFAVIGTLLAYSLLFAMLGFHWLYVPGGLAGAITAVAVGTALGAWARRVQLGRCLVPSVVTGVGIALVTLLLGALALGFTNFLLETFRELSRAPAGQPILNALAEFAPDNARSLVAPPVMAAVVFGMLPAGFLGLGYGAVLHVRFIAADRTGAAERKSPVGATLGALLTCILIASLVAVAYVGSRSQSVRHDEVPIAIGRCGSGARVNTGILAYCSGYPCKQGQCEWDVEQDAIALYVQPPARGGWSWTGGGLGTTRRPDVIQHQLYWVRKGPGGDFDENSPRRHVAYRLRFDRETVEISGKRFRFDPGMLIVVRFEQDWSFTVDAGRHGLQHTGVTIDALQQALDESCAMLPNCRQAFQLHADAVPLP